MCRRAFRREMGAGWGSRLKPLLRTARADPCMGCDCVGVRCVLYIATCAEPAAASAHVAFVGATQVAKPARLQRWLQPRSCCAASPAFFSWRRSPRIMCCGLRDCRRSHKSKGFATCVAPAKADAGRGCWGDGFQQLGGWLTREAILRTTKKPKHALRLFLSSSGGAEGDRTPDLHDANVALSQLSYRPMR